MTMFEEQFKLCKNKTDQDEELVWLPLEQIEDSEIKPTFVKERIKEILEENTILHIVEERDRKD